MGIPSTRTLSRPPEGLAEDYAPEECRRGDGDATNQRHRQFADCRCRSGELPDQNPAPERGIQKSGFPRILQPSRSQRTLIWRISRSAFPNNTITWLAN